jgi:uncharacterized protein Yka (UPF0111/DUF47 family)
VICNLCQPQRLILHLFQIFFKKKKKLKKKKTLNKRENEYDEIEVGVLKKIKKSTCASHIYILDICHGILISELILNICVIFSVV